MSLITMIGAFLAIAPQAKPERDNPSKRIADLENAIVELNAKIDAIRAQQQAMNQQNYVRMFNQQKLTQLAPTAQQMAMLSQAQQAFANPDFCTCVPARHDMLRPRE